jgi:hypothetical protein
VSYEINVIYKTVVFLFFSVFWLEEGGEGGSVVLILLAFCVVLCILLYVFDLCFCALNINVACVSGLSNNDWRNG